MSTNDTIRFWACLILSGVHSAAANILDGMSKPSGFNVFMACVWMAFVIIQMIAVMIKSRRG